MLLKLRFNKPAIDRFFVKEDKASSASHISCRVESGKLFSFSPLWLTEAESRGYLPLFYSERGSAQVELNGKFADDALESLRNVYNNPFFNLTEDGFGSILAKPYMSLSVGKVSSPRFEPIMRVFEIQDWSHDPPPQSSTLDVDLALARVIEAHTALKRKGNSGLSQEDLNDYRAIMERFEAVARTVLPIFSDVERLVAKYGHATKRPLPSS